MNKGTEHSQAPGAVLVSGNGGALDATALKQLLIGAGADDAGFAALDSPHLAAYRDETIALFPPVKALISFVVRMNRENLRNPNRSLANVEFHHSGDRVDEVSRRVTRILEDAGVRALYPAMGFPMEMDMWMRRKIWTLSHKPIAEAAGLGLMGLHRNVIHPKFGNFILLGTILIDAPVTSYGTPLEVNPCQECKLCVAACPTGAIGPDGYFDFTACLTHNYREFLGGFSDWVENVAASGSGLAYRKKVSDAETASMWQSLAKGPNYKAAYCVGVCPAGEDVIGPYLADKKKFTNEIVKPLREKEETVYAIPGSDAQAYVRRHFPHKKVKDVGNGIRPRVLRHLLDALPAVFNRHQSKGLSAVYHFSFTGAERAETTVVIKDEAISVRDGHHGKADLHVTADSETWLRFLAKEANIVWAIVTRKVKLKGPMRLLLAFGKCFPS